jgi:hypothetical protein
MRRRGETEMRRKGQRAEDSEKSLEVGGALRLRLEAKDRGQRTPAYAEASAWQGGQRAEDSPATARGTGRAGGHPPPPTAVAEGFGESRGYGGQGGQLLRQTFLVSGPSTGSGQVNGEHKVEM